ncbi:MAG: YesL family protein [Lachnospiraceae bacterium]|nr:YesL family protein [Lachnospiraceae bacterium]
MKRFFSGEGGFFGFMDKVAGLFWINLLTMICSIPVITAGAAVTACYYVTLKMVKNEEGYLTKSFFRSFRTNFRQSTLIWILEAVLISVFVADFWIIATGIAGEIPLSNVILVVTGILLFIVLMTAAYVFPILARYDNTTANTIKNAVLMGIANFPKTLAIMVTNALFPALGIAVIATGRGLWIVPILLCFGISAGIYLSSRILVRIFDAYGTDEVESEGISTDRKESDTEEIRVK